MAELLPVPEVAAGATEVTLSEWTVRPGQSIAAGDVIAVVETDKAVVEIEADRAATILRHLVDAGTSVEVGAPLVLLGTTEDLDADLDALLVDLGVGTQQATAVSPQDVPEAAASTTPTPPVETVDATDQDGSVDATGTASPGAGGGVRRFVSPIARKLLADNGLGTDGIVGTGPHGRIRRRDVEPAIRAAHASRAAATTPPATIEPAPAAPAAPAGTPVVGPWTDVPHTRLRRAIARRLVQSKQEVPHFYLRRTARIDSLLALRAQLNAAAPTKISVNDFLIRAMAVAHQDVPDANVIWTDDAVRRFDQVDISVAIASGRGLVTPVIRGVEQRSLSAISAEVKRFAAAADAGTLQQRDLEGGSSTISNLGMYGIEDFDAIINPPQATILAVGAGRSEPRVVEGEIVAATVVNLVLSVDHRAVDGALGAQWMAALVSALENPLRLVV